MPEDRKKQALFLRLAIRTNMTIAAQDQISRGWFIDERREDALIEEFRRLLSIRMASPDQAAGILSGGNQQKVVLARWLALRPKILIVDEPTRGIDVGSKVEVHNLLDRDGEVRHRRHRHLVRTAGNPRRVATASSPCARAGSPARSPATDATQEILMAMMTAHEGAARPALARGFNRGDTT